MTFPRPLLMTLAALALSAVTIAQQPPPARVSIEEIAQGLPADGSRWLTFGGDYSNHRHSPLTQIAPDNVARLQPLWTFQTATLGNLVTTSLLRYNVLDVTGPLKLAWAIDARTCRKICR